MREGGGREGGREGRREGGREGGKEGGKERGRGKRGSGEEEIVNGSKGGLGAKPSSHSSSIPHLNIEQPWSEVVDSLLPLLHAPYQYIQCVS